MTTVNSGLDEQLYSYIHDSIKRTAFYQLLELELQHIGPGYVELIVKSDVKHTNPLGLIHGGLIMSLADAAMANAIRSLGINGLTVDCSVALLKSVHKGDIITARGKVIKAGKNIIFAEASVYVDDQLIANSKGTFFKNGDIDYKQQER